MSSVSTKLLRELAKIQRFVPHDQWLLQGDDTNCVAYALGLPLSDPEHKVFRCLVRDAASLVQVMEELGFIFREISTPEEKTDREIVLVLYEYYYPEIHRERDYEGIVHEWKTGRKLHEVHMARIELDGTWTHKFGWDYPTSVTSPKEIHDVILREDNVDVRPSAFFAVQVC